MFVAWPRVLKVLPVSLMSSRIRLSDSTGSSPGKESKIYLLISDGKSCDDEKLSQRVRE